MTKLKVIDRQLKVKKGSKYKAAPPDLCRQYARDYTAGRLNDIGYTDNMNSLAVMDPRSGESAVISQFIAEEKISVSKNGYISYDYGTRIHYVNYKGQAYWTESEGKEITYSRFRFAAGLEWENAKYLSDKGSGYFAWLNGIYQFFVAAGVCKLKRAYVTEGEFKAAAACRSGIPTIGLGGIHLGVRATERDQEGKALDYEFLPEIQAFLREFEVQEVVLLHDQDATDNLGKKDRAVSFYAAVKNFLRASEKLGIKLIYKHIADSAPGKGIDDVIADDRSKIEAIRKAITSDHSNTYFKSFAVDSQALSKLRRYFLSSTEKQKANQLLRVEKYASEVQDEVFKVVNGRQRSAFTANTGTGKTDIAYRYADYMLRQPAFAGRVIFLFPTTLSSEQKAIQYSKAENNPAGIHLNIFCYNADTDPELKQYVGQQRIINCHACRLEELKPGPDDIIIVDEAHKFFIDDYDNTESNFQYILDSPSKVIFLTGTPFREFYKSHKIYELEIIRKQNPKVTIHYQELTQYGKRSFNIGQSLNIYMAEIENYVALLPRTANMIYPVFIQSIDRIRRLEKLIKKKGFDVACLYSHEDIKANSPVWKGLVDGGGLVPNCQKPLIILTTPLLYEGVDIKNENIGQVAVFGERWSHNLRQIAGRFRNCPELHINYFLTAADTKKGYYESFDTYRAKHYVDYTKLRDIFNTYNELIISGHGEHTYRKQQRKMIDANRYLKSDGSFNEFQCAKAWIRQRNEWLNHGQRLSELELCFTVIHEGVKDVEFSQAIEENLEKIKAKKQDAKKVAFEKVRENLPFALYLVTTCQTDARLRARARELVQLAGTPMGIQYPEKDPDYQAWGKGIDKEVRRHILKIISYYCYLSDHMQGNAGMINLIEKNYNEFSSNVKQQIAILHVLHGADPDAVSKVNRYLYREVISKFTVGEKYKPSQIRDKIDQVFEHYHHMKPGKNQTHFFRMLFDAGRRDRNGHYTIKGIMNMERYCSKCDTSPLYIDNIQSCNTVTIEECPF